MEIVDEGAVSAQRLLELSQREARVGGEERACGVHRFENHLTATATAHAIADNAEQFAGVAGIARLDTNHFVRAG